MNRSAHKWLMAVPVTAVFCAISAGAALAAGSTEGLADADRVLREAAAPGDPDSAPRRYATLLVLNTAARRVTTVGGARPQPDDVALVGGYNKAAQQLLREAAASGPPGCSGEQCPAQQLTRRAQEMARTPGFAQGVLQRFSTAAWQQAYMPVLFPRSGSTGAVAGGAPERPDVVPTPSQTATAPSPAAAPASPMAPGTTSASQAAPSLSAPAPANPAAGPLPTGFEFLAQMPTVERVLKAVTGADAADTKVQQQATFHFLAMDVLMTMRGGAAQVPPQFSALDRAYKAEVTRLNRELRAEVPQADLPRALMQVMSLPGNAAFKRQTFERFFDAGFTAAYQQKKGEFDSWRTQATARPGDSSPAAGLASPSASGTAAPASATTAPAAPAPQPATPTPARVLRSASGVDMMIAGLAMGEPLSAPRCRSLERPVPPLPLGAGTPQHEAAVRAWERAFDESVRAGKAAQKVTCFADVRAEDFDERGVSVRVAEHLCTDTMSNCVVSALLDQGKLVGVTLRTRGLYSDQALRQDLVEKYGKPTTKRAVSWQNNNGARWEAEALSWNLTDLVVSYRPLEGSIGNHPPNLGFITVLTARGMQLEEQERKRSNTSRPRI